MKAILAILLVTIGLLLAGCTADGAQNGAASSGGLKADAVSAPSAPAPGGMMNRQPPAGMMGRMMNGAYVITMTAGDFKFTPGTDAPISVKKGVPVKLLITSTDVEHGIAIPGLKINQKLPVGQQTAVEFTPDKTGTFPFRCSVPCGDGHRDMIGVLEVTD